MTALMVQGACSSAGKSLVATALCRAFRRRGIDVAPFKAQNMSNNARVVAGGEIGVAQYLQALAAGIEPDVRMNPVLVKPEGDTRSQVVLLGRPDLELSRLPWRERRGALWPIAENALRSLLAEHDLVVLEGAGSPAEINLRDTDLANMRSAKAAGARVLLVADIDRGGAFAHLYGTWALLPDDERSLLCGFVLNKFRGDPSLLSPGPERLEELTGVPTLGVLPWLDHGLPDEDGAVSPARRTGPRVAVIRYPTASNLDEFKPLEQVADLRWAAAPADLDGAELVVLPGSKHVAGDLRWLRRTGLADALAARRGRLLGICGGLQMLGGRIRDEGGVDGDAEGLGLLPLETVFAAEKTTRRTTLRFGQLADPWAALSGLEVDGYEIRHGRSADDSASVYVEGDVCGVYVHGLCEQPEIVEALLGRRPPRTLDDAFEALADAAEEHLDVAALLGQAVAA
jgi:adenosylcobyric acid synthase